jgi:DNA-binding PucR family transcriptional regulator
LGICITSGRYDAGVSASSQSTTQDLPDAVRDVLQRAAVELVEHLDEMAASVADAILEGDQALAGDTALTVEMAASSRANVGRLLSSMASRPGEQLPADVPPEALDLARTFVRRGIEFDTLAHAYRRGQNVAWQAWMATVLRLAAPEDLPQVLTHSARLVFAFTEDVLTQLIAQMERERDALRSGAAARRERTVALLLDGAPVDVRAASQHLGYTLDRCHTAFVIWSERDDAPQGSPERLAIALAHAAGARRALTVSPSATSLWGWIASDQPLDPTTLASATEDAPLGLRVTVAPTRAGVVGFRQSHDDALAAQRLVVGGAAAERLIAYRDVEVISLLGHDRQRLRQFLSETLGPLAAQDDATSRVRDTLRVFLQEGENTARAAARLNTHRNTVLHRISRAEELLGHRVGQRRLALAVALEAHFRLGLSATG